MKLEKNQHVTPYVPDGVANPVRQCKHVSHGPLTDER